MDEIITGNIKEDEKFKNQRNWIFGHFADPPFKTEHFEVKLSEHPKGKQKGKIAENKKASTFATLISGKFLITFYNKDGDIIREVLLEKPGDYVFYPPRVFHDWEAKEKSVTLAVRLPSIENDQKALKEV